jgi:hypothetical protein
MFKSDLNYLYIAFGIVLLLVLLANLYWGTFVILLAQPLFVSTFSEGAGTGVSKIVYGALFAVWFGAWALKPVARDAATPKLHSSVRTPALAFGGWLGLAILLGLIYGAPLDDIVRDLSQYVGYLAVLPLLDLVRTPSQAKRLTFFLALLGLPGAIGGDFSQMRGREQFELPPMVQVFTSAGQYWGPIQGAVWAVAVSFPGFAVKLLAWGWLLLKGSLSVFSGARHMLLVFILAALTAFMVCGRLARRSLARYLIPLVLALVVGGVVADQSGLITLPFSDLGRQKYSTLLSEKKFQRDDSMQGRFRESRWLVSKFLENPVTGIGLGHGLDDPTIPGGYNFMFHSGYHAMLMKFGVVGTCIFAWYFLALFRQAFEVARISDNYFAQVMGLGLVIWLVPALVASWAVNLFSNRGFALTVGVMAGLLPALTFSHQPVAAEESQVMEPVSPQPLESAK